MTNPIKYLSNDRIAVRYEAGRFGGPYVAVHERGAVTLWPLTHMAWALGSHASMDEIRALYALAVEALDLPPGTPCRMTNDVLDLETLVSKEVGLLAGAGGVLREDEVAEITDHLIDREEIARIEALRSGKVQEGYLIRL